MTKFASVFASCVLAVLVLTGCSDETNPDGSDEPTPTAPTTSTSPTPTPTTPAWQDRYSKQEIAAYEAALDRFATYEQRSETIWRKGKVTPAAEQLFKEYFQEGVWQTQMSRLRLYEQAEVEVAGLPKVLSSRPTRVAQGSVMLRQCVDYRPTTTTQYGEPTKPVKSRQRPVIRLVGLTKTESSPWLIYKLVTEPGGKDRPCATNS